MAGAADIGHAQAGVGLADRRHANASDAGEESRADGRLGRDDHAGEEFDRHDAVDEADLLVGRHLPHNLGCAGVGVVGRMSRRAGEKGEAAGRQQEPFDHSCFPLISSARTGLAARFSA